MTGGRLVDTKRATRGENRRVAVRVRPSSDEKMTLTLAATTDCAAASAICAADGRKLSRRVSATVAGPVGVSVADARVKEGAGAALAFAVTLSRAATSAFSVDYAISDGTAQAGADYTAASGTLSFEAGDSSKTIEVSVLDDAHDKGEETLTLRLSNASGAWLSDGEATGTIENADLMPAALLARFGRATAEQVVTHIEERMAAPRRRGFRARFAGRELRPGQERDFALGLMSLFAQPMGMGPAGAAPLGGAAMGGVATMGMGSQAAGAFGAGMPGMSGAMSLNGMGGVTGMTGTGAMGTGQHAPLGDAALMAGYGPAGAAHGGGFFDWMGPGGDLFSNSEFELNRESRGGMLSVWSRSSRSHFSGIEDALSLNGDVRTTDVRGRLGARPADARPVGGPHPRAGRLQRPERRADDDVDDRVLPVVGLPGQRAGLGVGDDRLRHGVAEPDAGRPVGARDGRVDDDVGGGDAGRADRLAGHRRVRAGVQGRRAVGRCGQRSDRRADRQAERLRGRGDAAAYGAGGLAGLLPRRRPAVADAEPRGGSAARRRRRRDGRRHGCRRRPRLHRCGHGAVAGRAGADAGGAPGRRGSPTAGCRCRWGGTRRLRARWG